MVDYSERKLKRQEETQAVINKDREALLAYKKRKNSTKKIFFLEDKVNQLEDKISGLDNKLDKVLEYLANDN